MRPSSTTSRSEFKALKRTYLGLVEEDSNGLLVHAQELGQEGAISAAYVHYAQV